MFFDYMFLVYKMKTAYIQNIGDKVPIEMEFLTKCRRWVPLIGHKHLFDKENYIFLLRN